jgi:tetratricopeptide (TPR) repeat protein
VNIGASRLNLGRCACLLNSLDVAKDELMQALEILEETSYWNGLAVAHQYLAEMYLMAADHDLAEQHARMGIELSDRHKNRRMQIAGWEQLARISARSGRTHEAGDHAAKALDLSGQQPTDKLIQAHLNQILDKSVLAADTR